METEGLMIRLIPDLATAEFWPNMGIIRGHLEWLNDQDRPLADAGSGVYTIPASGSAQAG